MKPVQYAPAQVVTRLDRMMNEFFNREIGAFLGSDNFTAQPLVNMLETPEAYLLELAAPGLEKTDFNIQVEGQSLLISANKVREVEEQQDGKILRKEFNYATFSRRFRLPNGVQIENITAGYENGVLKVSIPKSSEALQKQRLIEIG